MANWAKAAVDRYIHAGAATALMGALWLYLWVFPWYGAYKHDPRWGHNYAEALAFLSLGLAYFNGRLVSHVLAFLGSMLVIPASLGLWPTQVTAIAGAVIAALLIVAMIVERKRKTDLAQPANRRLTFWLKRHLPRFAYAMLGHIALTYYLVRLPGGTYETDLVTKVYDILLIPFVLVAMFEDSIKAVGRVPTALLGYFWGMLTMIVSLVLLIDQPETWVVLGIVVLATVLAIAALVVHRRATARAG